jgi:hypothetical protein
MQLKSTFSLGYSALGICIVLLGASSVNAETVWASDGVAVGVERAQTFASDNVSALGFALRCTYRSAYLRPANISGQNWPTDRSAGNFILLVADKKADSYFNYLVSDLSPQSEKITLIDRSDSWDDAAIFFDVDLTNPSFSDMSRSGSVNLDVRDEELSFNGITPFVQSWDKYGRIEPHQVMGTVSIDRVSGSWSTALDSGDLGGQAGGTCELVADEGEARNMAQQLMSFAFEQAILAFNAYISSQDTAPPKKF